MAYQLKSITIRTNNTKEGIKKIDEVWKDVISGKFPILYDSKHNLQEGISPISEYSKYASDENGDYDLSIIGVKSDFFQKMESLVKEGKYKKYNELANDLGSCVKKAWAKVWDEQKLGLINRAFSEDYESNAPAEYTKDGKAHCCLYISVGKPII